MLWRLPENKKALNCLKRINKCFERDKTIVFKPKYEMKVATIKNC